MTEHGETYEPRHRATVATYRTARADGPSAVPGVAVVVVTGVLASVAAAAVVLVGTGASS
ncbi:hypothetical protein [Aeromicrobium alkaliterrae]|uniref:Uncharacterized protein n=1 Tax=Aeromicrobium alkaliterrae TaxID=302168 RepID=A0ABN2JSR8_9ACTN